MNIFIIGAGAYGLALASSLIDKNNVTVYSSRKEEIDNLCRNYRNDSLFPNIKFSSKIKFSNILDLTSIDLVILAVPSSSLNDVLVNIKGKINKRMIICIACKGLINDNFSYDFIKKYLNTKNICILSGAGFAIDIINKENIVLSLAGNSKIKNIFSDNMKIEVIKDLVGIQLCGVLKNVFAIGSGILEGVGVSESTKASYLCKVISDMNNMIIGLKGSSDTINHSCGIGDVILTCSSRNSRNFTFGYLIGTDKDYNNYMDNNTIEGIHSLSSIKNLLSNRGKSSEIIDILYNIVFNHCSVNDLLNYIIK